MRVLSGDDIARPRRPQSEYRSDVSDELNRTQISQPILLKKAKGKRRARSLDIDVDAQ